MIILGTKGILNIEVIQSFAERVWKNEGRMKNKSSSYLPTITGAARLAHYGLLCSLSRMRLCEVNLTSVPAEHLASLASCVTENVNIHDVSGLGLGTILNNVKSKKLSICIQSLCSEETQALLGAMESRVEKVWLSYVNLTSVPAEHLSSQASCVTESVKIHNVRGCGLITILNNVKSKELSFWSQSLGSEETRALVRAIESRVEKVELDCGVTLDIRVLMDYNGQGKCRKVKDRDRYSEQLKTWARGRNWTVTCDDEFFFIIERI